MNFFLNTFTGRKGVKTKVKISLQEFYRQGRGNNTRTSGVWCSFQRSWVSQWMRCGIFKILKYPGESIDILVTQCYGVFCLWDVLKSARNVIQSSWVLCFGLELNIQGKEKKRGRLKVISTCWRQNKSSLLQNEVKVVLEHFWCLIFF